MSASCCARLDDKEGVLESIRVNEFRVLLEPTAGVLKLCGWVLLFNLSKTDRNEISNVELIGGRDDVDPIEVGTWWGVGPELGLAVAPGAFPGTVPAARFRCVVDITETAVSGWD